MHLGDFLGYAALPALRPTLEALAPLPSSARHCLLSGPERSGKTSLLFHAALSLARQGLSVLLLCHREKLEQVPPLLPEGVAINDDAWSRVAIKYIASGWELLRYASCVHMLAPPPDALLVDDLHLLADLPAPPGAADPRPRPRDMALCRILAALHEAVDVASRLNGSPCQLIVTEAAPPDGPRLLYILQRWLPLVLHIRPGPQGNVLSVLNPRPDVPPGCQAQLLFSLKHGALTLDAIQPAQQHQQPQHHHHQQPYPHNAGY